MQGLFVSFILEHYIFIAFFLSLLVGFLSTLDYRIESEKVPGYYKFWINFSGATMGWLLLYTYIKILAALPGVTFSFSHAILLLLALYGIVGFLPRLLIDITNSVGKIISGLASKVQ